MDKSNEQARQERERRLSDAIQLKVPDRVPIALGLTTFPQSSPEPPPGQPTMTSLRGKKPTSEPPAPSRWTGS